MDAAIDTALVGRYNQATITAFTNLWIENTLANYQLIRNSGRLADYKQRYAGGKAICVGAGPSLSKNIRELHAINEARIIAAESALPALMAEGIEPDFVMVNDPNAKIAGHFNGIDTRNLTLIAPYFTHPKVLQCFRGALVFYSPVAAVPVFKLCTLALGDLGGLYSGSCVGHSMNYLAHFLGCSIVVNIGQDLSYPGGARYANGICAVDENTGGKECRVADIFGKEVSTDERMLSYKHVFENTVAPLCSGIEFVNATQGGILALGKCMPLAQAIDEYSL